MSREAREALVPPVRCSLAKISPPSEEQLEAEVAENRQPEVHPRRGPGQADDGQHHPTDESDAQVQEREAGELIVLTPGQRVPESVHETGTQNHEYDRRCHQTPAGCNAAVEALATASIPQAWTIRSE